jgi:hypothetical protein
MSGVLNFDAPEVDQLDHDGVARQLSSHKMLSQMHQFTFYAQRPKAQRISTLYTLSRLLDLSSQISDSRHFHRHLF